MALSSREPGASFRDAGFVTHRQLHNLLVEGGNPCCRLRMLEGQAGVMHRDILTDGAAEQEEILEYHATLTTHSAQVQTVQRDTIKTYVPFCREIEAEEQLGREYFFLTLTDQPGRSFALVQWSVKYRAEQAGHSGHSES